MPQLVVDHVLLESMLNLMYWSNSVDLDFVDAIAVLDIAEAVAAEGNLDSVDVVAIGMTDSPDLALVFAAILVLDPGKAEIAIVGSVVAVHTVIFCEFLSNIYIFLLKIKV